MAQPPSPAAWEFYERKRRLAYHFAWLSMALLLAELSMGTILELYSHPIATPADGGICLLHRCVNRENVEGSQLLFLDAQMKPKDDPLQLLDTATAALPEGREVTVFYGPHASVLVEGRSSHTLELGQTWEVLSAVRDPGRESAWIFGWNEGKVVARRREKETWGPEIAVATSGLVDRTSACMDGKDGPLIAWRERSSTRVRTALFDGNAFVSGAEFELGDAQHWDAVRLGGRTILALYNREDRSFEAVTLRLQCCEGCAAPFPPRKVAWADPPFLLGRRVTGLSTVVSGDRLLFFLTRPSTLLWGSLQAATLEPERPSPKLTEIAAAPAWRAAVASVTPILLIFCSISLVFLGWMLFVERTRILSTGTAGTAAPAPEKAGLMARSMAYFLDFYILFCVILAITETLDPVEDLQDARIWEIGLGWLALEFVYHFVLEWAWGTTIGKWILGLRVTELDGSRLTFRGALLRNLLRPIDAQVPFGLILGIALILRTRRGQRLGDLAGRTVVVRDPGRRPPDLSR
jgi:uncharacterized RDD family membrane protein YckC